MLTSFTRRLVTATGVAIVVLIATALVLIFLIAIAKHIGLLSTTPEASYQHSLWAVLLSLSAGVAAFCIRSDSKEQSTLFGQWKVAGKWYVYAILTALAIRVASLSIWAMRGSSWVPGLVNEFFARAGESVGSTILALVYFCAVVPAVEEIIFRRGVFSALRRFPTWVPYSISVVLFTFLHGTPDQGGAFLLGLAAAYLYLRSGSLLPSIVCHAMANAIAVAVTIQNGQ